MEFPGPAVQAFLSGQMRRKSDSKKNKDGNAAARSQA